MDRRHQEVLKCGPKYCVEPRLSVVDKLALTRDIARSVPENEKERCVVECVDVIAKVEMSGRSRVDVEKTANYFVDEKLGVVQADKEGLLWFCQMSVI